MVLQSQQSQHLLGRCVELDRSRLWQSGLAVLFLAAAWLPTTHTIADPDIWGHVRFGQELLVQGELPATDNYSYTSGGRAWINHEIIAELLMAWCYDHWEATGLVMLKSVLAMGVLGLVFWQLRRRGLPVMPAGCVMLLTTMLLLPDTIMVRPHLFTYLFFAITVLVLEASGRGRTILLWCLPPLFTLWINTHGGVLAGMALLLIWGMAEIGRQAWRQPFRPATLWKTHWHVLLPIASCGIALLINPYGHHLITFLLTTATVPRPEISEWNAVKIVSFEGVCYLLMLSLVLLALLYSRRPKRFTKLAMLACTGVLPLLAQRHLPLFALAWSLVSADHLADAWQRWPARDRESNETAQRWVTAVPWIVAIILFAFSTPRLQAIVLDTKRFPMPVRAVELIRRSHVEGNLAVLFDWGEFAIWHLHPRVSVSIDGRRETVYSPEVYGQNMAFMSGTGNWDAVLTDHPTDMALVPQKGPCVNLMKQHPQWTLIYEDRLCALFARRGSKQAVRLTGPPATWSPPNEFVKNDHR